MEQVYSHIKNKHESELFTTTFPLENYLTAIENTELEKPFKKVQEICEYIKNLGGKGLLVGGSVRDLYFNKISKDYDIEVYGMDYEELSTQLAPFGELSEVGKAFGILKLRVDDIDLDISVPRKDSKIAEGHTGFSASFDKSMSIKDAALRRDYTMNTLAMNPLDGTVYDYFNAISDIQKKILKVTDPDLFKDDPLRVVRGIQFIGRFGLSVDESSKEIIKQTAKNLHEISAERLFAEFEKLFLKSEKPSLGLMAAHELEIFSELFPHFIEMSKTPQDKEWHPEGDVWVHTLMVVDEAAIVMRREGMTKDESLVQILSALLHDVGKPETTFENEEGRIVSPGHEQKGETKAREFLQKINAPKEIEEKVVRLVMNHMIPGSLYRAEQKGTFISDSAIKRLALKLHPATINDLVRLCEADSFGRGLDNIDRSNYLPGKWLAEKAEKLGIYIKKPESLLRGRDLINMGFEPGKDFGKIIKLGDRLAQVYEEFAHQSSEAELQKLTKYELEQILKSAHTNNDAIEGLKAFTFGFIQNVRKILRQKQQEGSNE